LKVSKKTGREESITFVISQGQSYASLLALAEEAGVQLDAVLTREGNEILERDEDPEPAEQVQVTGDLGSLQYFEELLEEK
jgi:predicted RNase H-like HicB family nuclease